MPLATSTLNWSVEFTASDGDYDFTAVITRDNMASVNISSIRLDEREDVASATLIITFPSIVHFYDAWSDVNPFALGARAVLKIEGLTRFTGMVTNFQPVYSLNDRSCVVTCQDKMWALKDAVVEIIKKRKVKRAIVNLERIHYAVTGLNQVNKWFEIAGEVEGFTDGLDVHISGCAHTPTNNGPYTCDGDAVFIAGNTRITVVEAIPDGTADGDISKSYIWTSPDIGGSKTWPWAEDYVIPLWIREPKKSPDPDVDAEKFYRVQYNEYQILYDLGGIYLRSEDILVLGADEDVDPDCDDAIAINTIDTVFTAASARSYTYAEEIWAEIVYYDETDTTADVDAILKTVFEYDEDDGGLGWTDGVDFNLEPTPQDKLNKMEWHTKQGDGDVNSFISNLYDNAFINFPQNYWIRDFEGRGIVTGKYVFQQSDLVFNGNLNYDPKDPLFLAGNWTYDDTVWTWDGPNLELDKDANGTDPFTQEVYARETETYKLTFTVANLVAGSSFVPSLGGTASAAVTANGVYVRYIIAGATGALDYTRTLLFTPTNTSRFSIKNIGLSTVPKDIDVIYDASFPSSLNSVYTRAILVNNDATGENISKGLVPVDLFSYAITGLHQVNKWFEIAENSLDEFLSSTDNILTVWKSTGNNKIFTILGAVWTGTHTRITVSEAIPSAVVDGVLRGGTYSHTNETPRSKVWNTLGIDYIMALTDGSGGTSWGYFKINKGAGQLDDPLPQDKPLFRLDLGAVEQIDKLMYSVYFTFGPKDSADSAVSATDRNQPQLDYMHYDPVKPTVLISSGLSATQDKIYIISDPQRITIEGNTATGATPDEDGWFPLHPDLFLAESTPGLGAKDWPARDAWHTVESIGISTRHIRCVVNSPLFCKVGETNSGTPSRLMMWCMTDIQIFRKGRLIINSELPSVEFVDSDVDPDRWRFGLNNTIVDMYRPKLLSKLDATTDAGLKLGLKKKTLVIENSDMFDFQTPIDLDPEKVSVGYKYLVSKLDAASRENTWAVRIDPRPDVCIGDTIYCTRINPDRYFLVHGSSIELTATAANQSLDLQDHDWTAE